MVHWKELTKNIDPKDLIEFGVFRETPDSDTDHHLYGVVVSKEHSNKSYNIVCKMDTKHFEEKTKMKVFCNCPDFTFRRAYVLHTHDALLAPQNFILTPPKKTNPNEILSGCKHIKVFLELKNKNTVKHISREKDTI